MSISCSSRGNDHCQTLLGDSRKRSMLVLSKKRSVLELPVSSYSVKSTRWILSAPDYQDSNQNDSDYPERLTIITYLNNYLSENATRTLVTTSRLENGLYVRKPALVVKECEWPNTHAGLMIKSKLVNAEAQEDMVCGPNGLHVAVHALESK